MGPAQRAEPAESAPAVINGITGTRTKAEIRRELAGRFDWERAVRQLDIRPPVLKLVALMLATYADGDGTNIHPGEARLAAECGLTERAVRGHLESLRDDLGLIVRVFHGSQAGRRKLADEYALQVPPDVLNRVRTFAAKQVDEAETKKRRAAELAEQRKHASGDAPRITGTSPSDHRKPGTDHRKPAVEITGSTLPPTSTCTTDVYQPSPHPHRHPDVTTESDSDERNGNEIRINPHEFRPDANGLSCELCEHLPQHQLHNIKEAS